MQIQKINIQNRTKQNHNQTAFQGKLLPIGDFMGSGSLGETFYNKLAAIVAPIGKDSDLFILKETRTTEGRIKQKDHLLVEIFHTDLNNSNKGRVDTSPIYDRVEAYVDGRGDNRVFSSGTSSSDSKFKLPFFMQLVEDKLGDCVEKFKQLTP